MEFTRTHIALFTATTLAAFAYYRSLSSSPPPSTSSYSVPRTTPRQLIAEGNLVWSRHTTQIDLWISNLHSTQKLKGLKIMVSGASSGLGRSIAAHALAGGAKVLAACRKGFVDTDVVNRDLVDEAVRMLELHNMGEDEAGDRTLLAGRLVVLDTLELTDLDSIDSTIEAAKIIGFDHLDAMINNAGLVSVDVTPTKHGFEPTFAVNFFGTVYLTRKAEQAGLLTSNSRVVMVSSEDHRVGPTIPEISQREGKPFGAHWGHGITDLLHRYDYSKLALVTYMPALARRAKYQSFDICPGSVGSDIARNNAPWPIGDIVTFFLKRMFVKPARAAIPVLRLAVDVEEVTGTGRHFHVWEERAIREDAADEELQEMVWEATHRMITERRAPLD